MLKLSKYPFIFPIRTHSLFPMLRNRLQSVAAIYFDPHIVSDVTSGRPTRFSCLYDISPFFFEHFLTIQNNKVLQTYLGLSLQSWN